MDEAVTSISVSFDDVPMGDDALDVLGAAPHQDDDVADAACAIRGNDDEQDAPATAALPPQLQMPTVAPLAADTGVPNVHETLYLAMQEDLEQKRFVDLRLSFYNQTTGSASVLSECHRLAMAVKSRILGRALRGLDHEEDVVIVVVGDEEEEGRELLKILYDPTRSLSDFAPWEAAAPEYDVVDDEAFCGFCKRGRRFDELRETTSEDGGYLEEGDGTGDSIEDFNPGLEVEKAKNTRRRPGRPRKRGKSSIKGTTSARRKLMDLESNMLDNVAKNDLTIESVRELVASDSKLIQLRERGLNSVVWTKFMMIHYDRAPIPFVCCRHCKLVRRYLPTGEKSLLVRHIGRCSNKEGVFAEGEDLDEDAPLSAKYLEGLIGVASEKVFAFPAEDSSWGLPRSLTEVFDLIKYAGDVVPFVVCKSCGKVLVYNDKKCGHLKRHSCKEGTVLVPSADQKAKDVSKEDLIGSINEKSELISLKTFPAMPNKSDKIKQIFYKNCPTTFSLCKVCNQVIKIDTINVHKCTSALRDLSHIYKNEPSRILVHEDVILNIMYPYIFPISLDGNGIEYALCKQCGSILPRDIVPSGDFKHRCHRILANMSVPTEKYHSDNLKVIPKKGPGGKRSYQCLLCNEVLSSLHRSEAHMRGVHGEGGREVMCSFCGKGFSTLHRAKQHELQIHDAAKNAGDRQYQCHECSQTFVDKGKLKRHMMGKHSEQAPFVCNLCGKSFRWEYTMRRHIETHGPRKYKCDFCEKTFFRQRTFHNHRMIHTGERPYTCHFCNQTFIQLTACKTHVLKRHGVAIPKGQGPKDFFEKNYPKRAASPTQVVMGSIEEG